MQTDQFWGARGTRVAFGRLPNVPVENDIKLGS